MMINMRLTALQFSERKEDRAFAVVSLEWVAERLKEHIRSPGTVTDDFELSCGC